MPSTVTPVTPMGRRIVARSQLALVSLILFCAAGFASVAAAQTTSQETNPPIFDGITAPPAAFASYDAIVQAVTNGEAGGLVEDGLAAACSDNGGAPSSVPESGVLIRNNGSVYSLTALPDPIFVPLDALSLAAFTTLTGEQTTLSAADVGLQGDWSLSARVQAAGIVFQLTLNNPAKTYFWVCGLYHIDETTPLTDLPALIPANPVWSVNYIDGADGNLAFALVCLDVGAAATSTVPVGMTLTSPLAAFTFFGGVALLDYGSNRVIASLTPLSNPDATALLQRTADGGYTFMRGDQVINLTCDESDPLQPAALTISVNSANVRSGPSQNCAVFGTLPFNTAIRPIAQVVTPSGLWNVVPLVDLFQLGRYTPPAFNRLFDSTAFAFVSEQVVNADAAVTASLPRLPLEQTSLQGQCAPASPAVPPAPVGGENPSPTQPPPQPPPPIQTSEAAGG